MAEHECFYCEQRGEMQQQIDELQRKVIELEKAIAWYAAELGYGPK